MLVEIPKVTVIICFSLLVIALQSPILAFVTIVAMILTLSINIVVSVFRLKYRRMVSEASSTVAGVMGDALSHAAALFGWTQTNQ